MYDLALAGGDCCLWLGEVPRHASRGEACGARLSLNKEEDVMITMTTAAEEKIRELMQEEQDTIGLRVFVKGGGCHGYQYGMSFESKMSDDDTVIEKGDVKVIMDSQSAPLLIGCEVDYVDALQGSGFAIKNPQAKTTCGCGSSFSS
ncbi:MAG TPA: iron-sulfur cluster insertion protein ErpA [Nitrospiraceae bacterium]|nr:iron-sulfur cluster insertion protein ErpA [Nitrospiraceae bacterium]